MYIIYKFDCKKVENLDVIIKTQFRLAYLSGLTKGPCLLSVVNANSIRLENITRN